MRIRLILLCVALISTASMVRAAEPLRATVSANQMAELEFVTALKRSDPFNEVELDVLFTEPGGKKLRVPAFWAGGRVWKVRYSSPVAGEHRFRTTSSDPRDTGLHDITGVVEVKPYTGDHPLYKHGPLRVHESKRYLEHADGTPFFWLGDTWWMGLSKRLAWPQDVKKLAQDRKGKGFNVIQIVMGPPPDSHPFDPRSVNDAGFPWETDYAAIRPEYYDAADKRILYLVEEGFTPCLFGMWGYHMRFMGVERAEQHWRYLVARYGALPVVWCVAGEANLSWYLAPGFPYHDKEQVTQWTQVTRYLHKIDPFDRLVTVHPTGFGWTARDAIDDASLLDFDMLQTPHGKQEAVPVTLEVVRRSRAGKPDMPTINGEAAYEMLGDSLPTEWTRRMFWLCMTNGAAGHTYGANGIWQVNRKGDPHGPSPHMPPGVGYGAIPWDDAMNLSGSTQVALGRKLFEQFEWYKFEPMPDSAAWADKPWKEPSVGEWIWFPEGEPAADAPTEARYFRRTFELPQGVKIQRAILHITADDRFTVWLNAAELGAHTDWRTLREFENFANQLKPGRNVLAVRAENLKSDVPKNPAGLAVGLAVELEGGKRIEVPSGVDWRASRDEAQGWQQPAFDDSAWQPAETVALFGGGPWGRVGPASKDVYTVPHATGIVDKVRIVYVPRPGAVAVKGIEKDAVYKASHFDPVTGEQRAIGDLQRNDAGEWRCDTPAGVSHDWVLILDARRH